MRRIQWIAGGLGLVLVVAGLGTCASTRPEPELGEPGWFETSSHNMEREFQGEGLVMLGLFVGFAGFAHARRQARQAVQVTNTVVVERPASVDPAPAQRLAALDDLLGRGLISQAEHQRKREAILAEL
jgi:hypothetical protein